MYDKILNERLNQQLYNEDRNTPIPPNSPEFKEIQFHFNTIFNDIPQRTNNSEQKIYGIDRAFSLKNQYISLNFEKREMNEVTSYGWYSSESADEKRFDDLVFKLRTKGLEKIENEINVSPLPQSNETEIHDIYICKFIIGESLIIFKGDDDGDLPDVNFEERAEMFRKTLVENDQIAVCGYSKGRASEIIELIRQAESIMYEEKKLYYERTGKERRY